jgi:hypothetical protein
MSGKTYASGENWILGLYNNLSADGNGSIETADFIDDGTAEDMKAYKVSGPGLKISGDVLAIGAYDLVLDREREIIKGSIIGARDLGQRRRRHHHSDQQPV